MNNFDKDNSKAENTNSKSKEAITEEMMAVIIAAVKEETAQSFGKIKIVSIEESK